MNKVRKFLNSRGGQACAIILALAGLAVSFYAVRAFLKSDTPDDAFYTTYICTETGKSFRHKNEIGETLPILSPYSGKNTGIPAEACYWTPDGGTKTEPTWVLLNGAVGKPGPTFCPDCGRLVVGHNPRPGSGIRPPPTQTEYAARHGGADANDTSRNDP